ncbi:hypothetical protein T484DRAFT_2316200 [Baffinella frigidus]|nr:hypothetical protein T484DRAFT_2316200 [Cryptophyta sp. CCMP2293]
MGGVSSPLPPPRPPSAIQTRPLRRAPLLRQTPPLQTPPVRRTPKHPASNRLCQTPACPTSNRLRVAGGRVGRRPPAPHRPARWTRWDRRVWRSGAARDAVGLGGQPRTGMVHSLLGA